MSERRTTEEVTQALASLQSAMKTQEIEKVLSAYSKDYKDPQGNDKASRREYFNGLFAMGIFRDAKFDMKDLAVVVDGNIATAAPVTYKTGAGTATYKYELKKEADGAWLISSSEQIANTPPPKRQSVRSATPANAIESNADRKLLGDAGRLVDRHAMLWIRRLNAPIEKVWDTVSTIDGLKKWWLVPPTKFDLETGGAFNHHWNNTIVGFKKHEYIDFSENTGNYTSTGGMRFELSKIDDNTTMFMFLDTWGPDMVAGQGEGAEQAGGPGTPWPGVAAGWHAMVDKLEYVIEGRESGHSYQELTEFYDGYLRDLYRWNAMVQRGPSR